MNTEPESTHNQPVVLTIAGTDSSGGAGIQADIKTFTAHLCYGTSVIVALTAQNTTGVQAVFPCPTEFIEQQLRSILDDMDVSAIKTGMLYDANSIRTIIWTLKDYFKNEKPLPRIVCDPVCVSTSGYTLLHPDAVEVMISELFPLTTIITPNKSEAELILSHRGYTSKITDLWSMLAAAKELLTLGPEAVLLKGGHIAVTYDDVNRFSASYPDIIVVRDGLLEENMEILQAFQDTTSTSDPSPDVVVDILQQSNQTIIYLRPRINSTSTHGTGCTLSAAIACNLSHGIDYLDAIRLATSYTHAGIVLARPHGKGFGPLNHMHSLMTSSIPRPTQICPQPLTRFFIQSTAAIWKEYVEHDFVKQLARGTLPSDAFIHFIKQDYLYLKYYARAYGLLAAKSLSLSSIKASTETIINVINEINSHESFCAQWGITETELLTTPESPATTAYGAYLIDCGLSGDSNKLLVAMAACLLGYGEVGLWLKKEAAKSDTWVVTHNNPYARWMENYGGEHYQHAVKIGIETIEVMAAADPPSPARLKEWCSIWERCTRLEKGFWDMALSLS